MMLVRCCVRFAVSPVAHGHVCGDQAFSSSVFARMLSLENPFLHLFEDRGHDILCECFL